MSVKRLRKARFSPAVAKVLCVLLLTPQLWAWITRPAAAQVGTHLTVVVVDFNNETGVGGPLLGRRAAAAMSLQLRQSDLWDPVNQSDVDRKIAELNMHPPFDRPDLLTLARSLDAQAVLFGRITAASVSNNPAQATVRMVVELMDVGSGELINGAMPTGTAAHIGMANAQDVLLDEALSKAAFDARQSMERYQLPQGTVQNTSVVGAGTEGGQTGAETALLNIGARQGVHQGMRFVVLRGHEVVGYLSASRVDPDKTEARVTQNFRGVKPEDIARAIYALPEGAEAGPAPAQPQPGEIVNPNVTPPQHGRHKSFTGPLRMFAGLLLAVGVAWVASNKHGGTAPGTVAAQAARVAGTGAASSAVRITWNRPNQIPPNAIVQYQVYRVDPTMGAPILVGIAFEADREWYDTTIPTTVTNFFVGTGGDAGSPTGPANVPGIIPGVSYRYYIQTVYNEGVTLNATTTGTTTAGTTTTGTTTTGTTTTGTTTTGTTTTGTTTTGTTTTGTTTTGTTTTGTTTTGTTTTGTTTAGTTTTGTTTTGGGATSNTGTGLLISQPSSYSGQVTPLVPPTLNVPQDQATNVDLTAATFTWTSVAGADVYSVQVNADPTNPNGYQQVVSVLNPSKTAGLMMSRTVNIATNFAGRTILSWRVGAKNSADPNAPVDGYVFSDVRTFTPTQAATASVRFHLYHLPSLNPTRSDGRVSSHRGGRSR